MVLFQFGVAGAIDHNIMLYSILLVIAFLIAAEMITGVLEYTVHDSPLYTKMILKIYKMLMFLGIISFTLLLLQSVSHPSHELLTYLKAIDFAHIILFFVALFFVFHVLYLMYVGTTISKMYRYLHKERYDALLSMVNDLKDNTWNRMIYNINPFSFLRQKVKFKIIHSLFRDNYSLPETFDFSSYLNGCFEGYALRIIDIGIYGWVIIIFLSIVNYIRIKYHGAFNCSNSFGSSFHNQRHLAELNNDDIIGLDNLSEQCLQKQYTLYLLCGCIVSIYSILVLIISYFYEARLIEKCGITVVDEYVIYLEFAVAEVNRLRRILDDTNILSGMKELKKNIEELIDANEYSENDEDKLYKYIAEKLSEIVYYIREKMHTIRSNILLTILYFNSSSIPRRDKKKSILLIEHTHLRMANQGRRSAGVTVGIKNKEIEKEKLKNSLSKKRSTHNFESTLTHMKSVSGTINNTLLQTEEKLIWDKFRKSIEDSSKSSKDSGSATGNSPPTVRRSSIFSKQQFEIVAKSSNLSDTQPQSTAVGRNTVKRKSVVVVKAASEDSSLDRFRESMVHRNSFQIKSKSSSFLKTTYCPTIFTRLYNFISTKIRKVKPIQRRDSLSFDVRLSDDFSTIFLFGSKELYTRAVETSIIFNCLYMAVAATTFIPAVISELDKKHLIYLFIPILISLFCFGKITRICSMLMAVCDLDLEVIHTVLAQEIDSRQLADEFRVTMEAKITEFKLQNPEYLSLSLRETVERVFEEIDEDGSGTIDSIEFRKMLRQLNLFYSDRRFKTLYNSMDIDGDGGVTIDELEKYIFTPEQLQREEELIRSREAMKLELGENGDNQDDRSSSSSNDTTDYNTVSESAQQEGNIFNSGDSKEREQISLNNNIESSDNSPEVNHIATENDIVNANSEKNNNDAENIREAQTTVM
jgi:hypothetical protein